MLLQLFLVLLLPVGCLGVVVEEDISGGLITVVLFKGLCGAGAVVALVRQPPPSHSPAQGVTSETTPGLFFDPFAFFGLHLFLVF